jgi:hypothetical protein
MTKLLLSGLLIWEFGMVCEKYTRLEGQFVEMLAGDSSRACSEVA